MILHSLLLAALALDVLYTFLCQSWRISDFTCSRAVLLDVVLIGGTIRDFTLRSVGIFVITVRRRKID